MNCLHFVYNSKCLALDWFCWGGVRDGQAGDGDDAKCERGIMHEEMREGRDEA